jgi:hypothetical protein
VASEPVRALRRRVGGVTGEAILGSPSDEILVGAQTVLSVPGVGDDGFARLDLALPGELVLAPFSLRRTLASSRISSARALSRPAIGDAGSPSQPLQGSFETRIGRCSWGPARDLAHNHLPFRFALAFGRVSASLQEARRRPPGAVRCLDAASALAPATGRRSPRIGRDEQRGIVRTELERDRLAPQPLLGRLVAGSGGDEAGQEPDLL